MINPVIVVLIVATAQLQQTQAQSNGNFWWQNQKLVDSARESRNNNNVKAIIENASTINKNVVNRNFKEDALPDCLCVAETRCSSDNYIIADAKVLRATGRGGICGANERCCRIRTEPAAESIFPTTTSATNFFAAPDLESEAVLISNLLDNYVEDVKKCGQRGAVQSSAFYNDPVDQLSAFAEFPWMVGVFHINPVTKVMKFKCGAALLSPFVAVTVAHCLAIDKNNPQNFVIRAGDWDINGEYEFNGYQNRTIKKFKRHPNFYSGNLFNDLALLIWNQPLDMSQSNVGTICLPDGNESFDGKHCLVTGWNAADDSQSNVLKLNNLIAKNPRECEQNIQKFALGNRFRLHQSFVCADGAFGQHVCKLQAGSPMVCARDESTYVLTGLFSWRVKCENNIPGVYTNIAHFTNWLQNEVDNIDVFNLNNATNP